MTECFAKTTPKSLVGGKEFRVDFEGGKITSDGGVLLLKGLDDRLSLSLDLAACLKDKRDPSRVQHSLVDLIRTRLYLIAQGYEDCNDADRLRYDPLLLTALGRLPESGQGLPSQPTLSRFENGHLLEEGLRWKDLYRLSCVFLERFERHYQKQAPTAIVIDMDGTDDRTHGYQPLSLFNGYHGYECYLPYLIQATVDGQDEHFLGAVLRPGNSGNAKGALGILKRIVLRLKRKFRGVRILVRLDGGFAVPEIYTWCEAAGIEYVIRFPENDRVLEAADRFWIEAKQKYQETQVPVCEFHDVKYKAKGWPAERRVGVKVTVDEEGVECWFLVTNATWSAREVDAFYRERGNFENRIKEMKLDLKVDRTSCTDFKAHQLRLILTAASYILFGELKRFLENTPLASAQVGTLRVTLMKLGALVKESARRVWVHLSSHFVFRDLFTQLWVQIRGSTA